MIVKQNQARQSMKTSRVIEKDTYSITFFFQVQLITYPEDLTLLAQSHGFFTEIDLILSKKVGCFTETL